MEIAILDNKTLKIKTKKTTFIIDPTSTTPKTPADGVIFLKRNSNNLSKITDYRLVIDGPGEFELGGVKISGIKLEDKIAYSMFADGMETVVGEVSALNKLSDKFQEKSVAILSFDEDLGEAVITTIEPKIVVMYGEKVEEGVKSLSKDKESVEKTKKVNVSEGKLPEEMQVLILQ